MCTRSNAIEVKVTEPVATVVLNRPDRRNALTRAMIAELREALRDLYLEKRVRAIVLTGAGDAFCSGRDIAEMVGEREADDQPPPALTLADLAAPGAAIAGVCAEPAATEPTAPDPDEAARWGDDATELRGLLLDMLELPKPIIASVNGPAVGCGGGLVLASDIVVAGAGARFGFPEPRRGVVSGVTAPLVAFRLGASAAARLLLTTELVPAEEAHRLGAYHEIIAEDLLWARAAEIGRGCSAAAAEALALTKRLLLETSGEQLAVQLSSGAIASATARTTDAAREGLSAFLEAREPTWPR
ncbi:MAG: enoyl-CoA hydratase/isomerase family protein [Planctomycetota bacterium]